MRKAKMSLAALAACGMLAAPAGALAATQLSIAPKLSGRLGGAGAISFNLTNTNTLGGLPSPMTAPFVAHLPAGIAYNVSSFGTCSLAVINAATGSTPPRCPAASQIGTGTATLGVVIGGVPLNETAPARIYLTRKSPVTIQFWASGTTPIAETLSFPGTLSRDSAPYGQRLTVQVPTIPTVPGGPNAATLTFDTTFSATRKVTRTVTVKRGRRRVRRRVTTRVSEFTLPKKCRTPLRWSATATYQDGTSSTRTATTACPHR